MAEKDLYQGPGKGAFDSEKMPKAPVEGTVADQARGWGVPEVQLQANAPGYEPTVTFIHTGGIQEVVPARRVGRSEAEQTTRS